jgi:DNA-directed RNA polymerase specialized sigma24 family protein
MEAAPEAPTPALPERLIEHRDTLAQFLRREGAGLLRYESVADLVQGVHLHAIEAAARFEYRGEAELVAWLKQVARQHIADRHRYWQAQKRSAGKLLRITSSDLSSGGAAHGVDPAALLGLSLDSAERARRRTIERFLRLFHRLYSGPPSQNVLLDCEFAP